MNTPKLIGFQLILFVLAFSSFGQSTKPQLIDSFDKTNCEEIMARMDNLFINLQNNPQQTGYILILGQNGKSITSLAKELVISGYIKTRVFPAERIKIIRAGMANKSLIDFWIASEDNALAEIKKEKDYGEKTFDYKLSGFSKPFKLIDFTKDFPDIRGICSPYQLELFSKLLQANPKMRGNIVFHRSSKAKYYRARKKTLAELTRSGIKRKRLRTFYVRYKPPRFSEELLSFEEFWLLP